MAWPSVARLGAHITEVIILPADLAGLRGARRLSFVVQDFLHDFQPLAAAAGALNVVAFLIGRLKLHRRQHLRSRTVGVTAEKLVGTSKRVRILRCTCALRLLHAVEDVLQRLRRRAAAQHSQHYKQTESLCLTMIHSRTLVRLTSLTA